MKRISKKTFYLITTIFVCVLVLISEIWGGYSDHGVKPPCVENLKIIQQAKISWMYENNKTFDDIPTWDDIKPYMTGYAKRTGWKDGLPNCPKGGYYTIGKIIVYPKCSIGGLKHSIYPSSFPKPFHP